MRRWSFKVKVGVYSALLTMAALLAGGAVMMATLYFYQISELDETLGEEASELVWDLKNFRDAPEDPREPLSEAFIPVPLRDHYLIVRGPDGTLVYQSENLRGTWLDVAVGEARTVNIFGDTCRIGAWKEGPYLVQIGAKVSMIERFMKNLGVGFATSLPAVGLVVFVGGMWLARRTVAPVAELSAAAERISTDNPEERLPLPETQDEIAKLTEVLNRSFDRLQNSYDVATRFSADASHQLKTPVSILRAGLDHLSRSTELTETQASEISMMRQQTRRLTSLIDDLLLLAQADAGTMFLERGKLDLVPLIESACDDLQTLADGKDISVEQDLPATLVVSADRRRISMILQNLVENAAKYTPDGGRVRVSGLNEGGGVSVTVANSGPGISEEDRLLVFERFRRGRDTGGEVQGQGLGLNIARELARAHGGTLKLKESEPGWTDFELRIPVVC